MPTEEEYLKDDEAANFLNLSKQTLRNWRTQGRGPAYSKAGRAVRYSLEDLRRYMEKNRIVNNG